MTHNPAATSPRKLRRRNVRVAVGITAALALTLVGCTPEEKMTPHEARDALVDLAHSTAELLDVDGWTRDSVPTVRSCGDGNVKYGYGWGAPQPVPVRDRLADATTVANYWESLGMDVRLITEPDPVVFSKGGTVQGLAFSTAPGNYYISGTSRCVPGDIDPLRLEENREPANREDSR